MRSPYTRWCRPKVTLPLISVLPLPTSSIYHDFFSRNKRAWIFEMMKSSVSKSILADALSSGVLFDFRPMVISDKEAVNLIELVG